MSDQDKVEKGAVKELARKHVAQWMLEPLLWDIDALEPMADIQPPARIEAAIRYLRKEYGRDKSDVWNDWELANALAWAFGLPQEENKGSVVRGTWKPEDFGLGPEKEGLEPVTDKDRRY